MFNEEFIEVIAHSAYACVQVWRVYHNENLPLWEKADDDLKAEVYARVKKILTDPRNTDSTFHVMWVEEMEKKGWTFGKVYEKKKTHPLIVPFHLLPPPNQVRERVFRAIVLQMGRV